MTIRRLARAASTHRYDVVQLESVPDLIRFVGDHCSDGMRTLFRGQQSDWPLVPKVARVRVDRGDRVHVERRMLDEFERTAISHVPDLPANRWEVIAIAQHYGLPTRLLDWSESPLVAAWFAVSNPPLPRQKGVIWIYTPDEDVFLGRADRDTDPFEISSPVVFFPRHVAARIRSQDGVFTAHPRRSKGGFVPFENDPEHTPCMIKLVVPPTCFASLRYDLDSAGIHAGSLFPDLAGLAQRITDANVRKSDE